MKYQVFKQSGNNNGWIVELPASFCNRLPAIGESFEIRTSHDGKEFSHTEATLVADGRSLKIGNRVVRFSRNISSGKGNKYKLGLGSEGDVNRVRLIIAKPVRAVEPKRTAASLGGGDLKSPMTGKVISVLVNNDSVVKEGDTLVVIEAMKMENRIVAECHGVIKNIRVEAGKSVTSGETLLTVEPKLD